MARYLATRGYVTEKEERRVEARTEMEGHPFKIVAEYQPSALDTEYAEIVYDEESYPAIKFIASYVNPGLRLAYGASEYAELPPFGWREEVIDALEKTLRHREIVERLIAAHKEHVPNVKKPVLYSYSHETRTLTVTMHVNIPMKKPTFLSDDAWRVFNIHLTAADPIGKAVKLAAADKLEGVKGHISTFPMPTRDGLTLKVILTLYGDEYLDKAPRIVEKVAEIAEKIAPAAARKELDRFIEAIATVAAAARKQVNLPPEYAGRRAPIVYDGGTMVVNGYDVESLCLAIGCGYHEARDLEQRLLWRHFERRAQAA